MTVNSVMQAAAKLLRDNVPQLVTIQDIEEAQPTILPAQSPTLVLQNVNWREKAYAGVVGGTHLEEWDLDNHVWAFYGELHDSNQLFGDLLDAIMQTYRASANYRFSGTADTARTSVLIQGQQLQMEKTAWQNIDGMIARHAVITDRIQELVQT